MDENPYKPPEEEGTKLTGKHSDFLDPEKNAAAFFFLVVVAVSAVFATMIVTMIRER